MKICGIAGQGTVDRDASARRLIELMDTLIGEGVEEFVVSMDEGKGLWAANVVRLMKKIYPGLRLTCLLLWEEQAADWPEGVRDLWFDTVAACDREVMLERRRSGRNPVLRDRFLLEHCDGLLLLWDGAPGPVWSLAAQARAAGLPVRELA